MLMLRPLQELVLPSLPALLRAAHLFSPPFLGFLLAAAMLE
jgi:hypothetical protein